MSDLTDAGARKDAKLMGIYRSIEAQPQAFDDIVARVLGGKFMITAEELLGYVALFRGHEDKIGVIYEKCANPSACGFRGYPPLHLAALQRNVAKVKKLLELGAPVNAKSRDSSGALHVAVRQKSVEVVTALCRAGADLEMKSESGFSALHSLGKENVDLEIAQVLIRNGADVHSTGPEDLTPALRALCSKNYDMLKLMVEFGRKPPRHLPSFYLEPLRGVEGLEDLVELMVTKMWAPREGVSSSIPNVKAIITAAVEASAATAAAAAVAAAAAKTAGTKASSSARGSSLSHEAVNSGDVAALAELLNSGEDPNAVDSQGRTPLHTAATLGHVEAVKALLKAMAGVDVLDENGLTPLSAAVCANKPGVVEALLQGGAAPNVKDSKGFSALHAAVKLRNRASVEALIAGGASLGAGGEKGETPLHVACLLDEPETITMLLRAGAIPGHCWNELLQSPLFVACSAGNVGAVKQLLPHLSVRQINMRDRVRSDGAGGKTALMAAVRGARNKLEMVQALLEAGADPTIRSASLNASALIMVLHDKATAADPMLGPSLVRALIGADVNDVGPDGLTVLHHACLHGACAEVVQVLLDAGANARAACAGYAFLTPIQLAVFGGNPGVMRVMTGLPGCGGLNAVGDPPESASILAYAVHEGRTEVVRFLLEEGADVDLLPFEDDGITPSTKSLLHMAVEKGHGEVAYLLLQASFLKGHSERA